MSINRIFIATISILIAIVLLFGLLRIKDLLNDQYKAQQLQAINTMVDQVRGINHAFAEELTMTTHILASSETASSETITTLNNTQKRNNEMLYEGLKGIKDLAPEHYENSSLYILVDEILQNFLDIKAIRKRLEHTPPLHPEAFLDLYRPFSSELARLRIVLLQPTDFEQLAIYDNLVIKQAAADLFDALAEEGNIILSLIARNKPMDADIRSRLAQVRWASEDALSRLRIFSSDEGNIHMKEVLPPHVYKNIIQSIDNLNKEIEKLDEIRRGIYTSSIVYNEYPIKAQEWTDFFQTTLNAVRQAETAINIPTFERASLFEKETRENLFTSSMTSIVMILLMVGIIVFIFRRMIIPIRNITTTMRLLSSGSKNINLPQVTRNDEIGEMVQALQVFRETAQTLDTLKGERAVILEQMTDGIIVTNLEGIITDWPPSSEQMFSISRRKVLGKDYTKTLYPQDPDKLMFNEMAETLLTTDIWSHEIKLTPLNKKNDAVYDITAAAQLDENDKPIAYILIFHDITEQKEGEKRLREAKNQAESANVAKTEFLANMSHEIRTPMNGIIGMTQLMTETELTPSQKDFCETIDISARNLLNLINDLLDLSKIESGKLSLENIPFNLRDLICELVDMVAPLAHDKSVELINLYPPDVPAGVIGDPTYIRQLVQNLLSNAIKFTEKGHVKISTQTKVLPNKQILFTISVEDTGIGIDDNKQSLIFDKFTQADTTSTRKFGGTGLGLAICKQLSELMGGDIDLQSSPGEGSTFTAHIPLHIHPTNESNRGLYRNSQAALLTHKKSISDSLIPYLIYLGFNTHHSSDIRRLPSGNDILIVNHTEISQISHDDISNLLSRNGKIMVIQEQSSLPDQIKSFKTDAILSYPINPKKLFKRLNDILRDHFNENKEREPSGRLSANILLAEDNIANQKVAQFFLEKLGCKVEIANTGREVLELLDANEFDMIFMDCQMPDLDGFETTSIIRKKHDKAYNEIPIIALTAHATKEDKDVCLNAGMDDFMTKPVDKNTFEELIRRWVQQGS